MKTFLSKRVGLLSVAAATLCLGLEISASGASCPLVLPANNTLTAYITSYPDYNTSSPAGVQQQLTSWFLVDVTSTISGATPPIPYGLYPTWCVDEWDTISPTFSTVPGTEFTGKLYSTCDPNLNTELPAGHPGTLVSSSVWQEVNYILNHQTYDGTNAFYWDVQAAINTLVGSAVGQPSFCGTPPTYTTPLPDGVCGYPTYDPVVVNALVTAAGLYASSWVAVCGDVYGVIYVTQPTGDQFILLEVPVPCTSPLGADDTATIGFWHNKNGQALIDSLNGGPNSTALATWLALNFPYLYGADSPNNLTGKKNTDVAALFLKFFSVTGQKTGAQILAGALAAYVTDSALAGTTAASYGFNVTSGGTGADTFNVGSNGTAIGLLNNTSYTILQLLQQANLTMENGTFNANAFNTIFSDINQGGDI